MPAATYGSCCIWLLLYMTAGILYMTMSTNDADRLRHYTAGDSTFAGDYLWSLKQVLYVTGIYSSRHI